MLPFSHQSHHSDSHQRVTIRGATTPLVLRKFVVRTHQETKQEGGNFLDRLIAGLVCELVKCHQMRQNAYYVYDPIAYM
jgi:hypothetical protein